MNPRERLPFATGVGASRRQRANSTVAPGFSVTARSNYTIELCIVASRGREFASPMRADRSDSEASHHRRDVTSPQFRGINSPHRMRGSRAQRAVIGPRSASNPVTAARIRLPRGAGPTSLRRGTRRLRRSQAYSLHTGWPVGGGERCQLTSPRARRRGFDRTYRPEMGRAPPVSRWGPSLLA